MIERELVANWNSVMYQQAEDSPMLAETYGQEQNQQMMVAQAPMEQPGFGEVSPSQFARGVADTAASTLKGAVQGFAGLPGDLEMIGRLLVNLVGGDVNEETYLATTEDIKRILDTYAPMKSEMEPRGEEMAETMGELLAPGGYLKGVKAVTKGSTAKKVGKRGVAVGGASATIKQSQPEPK
jgi:hypothetical protein